VNNVDFQVRFNHVLRPGSYNGLARLFHGPLPRAISLQLFLFQRINKFAVIVLQLRPYSYEVLYKTLHGFNELWLYGLAVASVDKKNKLDMDRDTASPHV